MRAQFDSLIDAGWGVACGVTRLSGSKDGAGHIVGSYASVVTSELMWIQATSGRSSIDVKNLDAETTHFCFQKHSGYALIPKDRILPSGATYVFDVLHTEVLETHRMSQVKQVLRA